MFVNTRSGDATHAAQPTPASKHRAAVPLPVPRGQKYPLPHAPGATLPTGHALPTGHTYPLGVGVVRLVTGQ